MDWIHYMNGMGTLKSSSKMDWQHKYMKMNNWGFWKDFFGHHIQTNYIRT
jgi:hypothetical protein